MIYALIPLFYFTVLLLLLLFELLYYAICDGECAQCEIEKHDVCSENTSAKCVAVQVSQWTSMNILQICLERFLEFHEGDCDIESEREE